MRPILTQDEIKLPMREAYLRERPWRHIWALALLTGMRSGELYALKWSDVDLDNKIIRITKSFNPKIAIKSTKNSDWRNGHISSDLENVLIELKNERSNEEFVLPHLTGWDHGYAGTILRNFLKSIGIENYVYFHTLWACFATHVLASGAEPTQVMKMGGWADFKTFQIYVRMAGVDVKGVTDNFRVMPKVFENENVVSLKKG
jgi:integrase